MQFREIVATNFVNNARKRATLDLHLRRGTSKVFRSACQQTFLRKEKSDPKKGRLWSPDPLKQETT